MRAATTDITPNWSTAPLVFLVKKSLFKSLMLYYHQILDSIFCQLVFFQLGQNLYMFLEMIDRKSHSSELMHLSL